jgi:hypothetical protein
MGAGMGARIAVGSVVAFAGLGWGAAGTAALAPEELVPGKVAVGLKSPPKPGGKRYEKLKADALSNQLEMIWILGQAAEWDIYVTRREVKRELGRIKKESFRSPAEFRQFIEEARYSRRDLHERVRAQILSIQLQERLQQKIPEKAGQRAEQKFFREFIEEFNQRWRARTVCALEFVTERCSNSPPSGE